jgi:hypothetical protein
MDDRRKRQTSTATPAKPGDLPWGLDTTARYTRVATGMIAGIESPLDLLSQPRKKPKKPKKNKKDQPPA